MSVSLPQNLKSPDGERLLRPLRVDDADTVARLAAAEAVSSYSRLVPEAFSIPQTEAWIRRRQDDFATGRSATWAVITEDRSIFVGLAAVCIDSPNQSAEADFWIGEPFRQQGHGRAVLETLRAFVFQSAGLRRLELRHVTTDPAAERLVLSCGFLPEGIARQQWILCGTFQDIAQYGLLASD